MIETSITCDHCGGSLNGHAIFINSEGHNVINLVAIETTDRNLVESYARRYKKVACGEQCAYRILNKLFDRVFGRTRFAERPEDVAAIQS